MTEAELIRQIHRRAHDLRSRSGTWQDFFRNNTPENARLMLELGAGLPDPQLPPPATPEAVRAAEEAVGFRFPPILTRLWTEVANGGFGPGDGIFGVEGGWGDDHATEAQEDDVRSVDGSLGERREPHLGTLAAFCALA